LTPLFWQDGLPAKQDANLSRRPLNSKIEKISSGSAKSREPVEAARRAAVLPGFANRRIIGYVCALPFFYRPLPVILIHRPIP
jgi:hypothetical protein